MAGLKLIAKARRLLDSHIDESDSPFSIFLSFVYHAEGRVIQKYIEEKMDLTLYVPSLPDYEEDESDVEEEK